MRLPDRRSRIVLLCLGCILIAGCSQSYYIPLTGGFAAPQGPNSTQPSPSATTIQLEDDPTQTALPTPTLTPTPTATPTPENPWGYFQGPTADSEIAIPEPVAPITFPPHIVNILLLGSDRRPYSSSYRTDTLMVLSLDPVNNNARLLSIPRDLYVYIPGWKVNRINTAEPRGGPKMLEDTILYNLGIPIQHWVKVEFNGVMEAIDILGGVTVYSTGRLFDECGGTYYRYEPDKEYLMDGFTALCYARMRKGSSDFDRLRRQQEVLQAMFDKLFSVEGLWEIPELYDIFLHTFQSDMQLLDVLPLASLATTIALEPERIEKYRIDQSMVRSWRTPRTGAAVLLPEPEAIATLLQEAFVP